MCVRLAEVLQKFPKIFELMSVSLASSQHCPFAMAIHKLLTEGLGVPSDATAVAAHQRSFRVKDEL